jgi:hypothetical protein
MACANEKNRRKKTLEGRQQPVCQSHVVRTLSRRLEMLLPTSSEKQTSPFGCFSFSMPHFVLRVSA